MTINMNIVIVVIVTAIMSSYLLYIENIKKKQYIENEDKIIREAILRNPEEFQNLRTNFEILSKMQHYEFPTRLLDLTENPLVALYFAVSSKNNKNKDGCVIIFKINRENIKYYDSDTVSILCAIAKIESKKFKDFQEEFKSLLMSQEDKEMENLKDDIIKNKENIVSIVYNYMVENSKDKKLREKINEVFNQTSLLKYITQEVKLEKPYFNGQVDLLDFHNRIVYVKSKMDTKRISAQQGSFLLFGIKDADKSKYAQFEEKQIETIKVIVPKQYKNNLFIQLSKFGITQDRLFPEITNSAKVIKSKL